MFERFTERARRAIFFGGTKPRCWGVSWIEAEHLLPALMKEDEVLPHELKSSALQRRLSADLPLSRDSHFAADHL
jgi:hypothetical protein